MDRQTGPDSSTSDSLRARIDKLESLAAYQEQTIEELSASLAGQWKEIDALKRALARLGEKFADLEAQGAGAVPVDKPPHY